MSDKPDLWSLTRLALAFERDRQALARALNDLPPDADRRSGRGTDRFWRLARVLKHAPVLKLLANGICDVEAGELDLNAERARLAKWQADKTAQDVDVRAGRMLWADDVQQWVSGVFATIKQRLVQIPDSIRQVIPLDVADLVVNENRRLIYEALEELASNSEVPRPDADSIEATSDPDGERVGGPVPKAVKRKQRRARKVED